MRVRRFGTIIKGPCSAIESILLSSSWDKNVLSWCAFFPKDRVCSKTSGTGGRKNAVFWFVVHLHQRAPPSSSSCLPLPLIAFRTVELEIRFRYSRNGRLAWRNLGTSAGGRRKRAFLERDSTAGTARQVASGSSAPKCTTL
jgi:hypothetical protein